MNGPNRRPAANRDRAGASARSARQREASRANGRSSRGPKAPEGKARSSRNACRHGLSLPAFLDPTLLAQVGDLARAIAGADADAHRLEIALRIAAAHIDVVRVRQVRCDLFSAAPFDCATLVRSAALERYERRALSRRKFAMNSMPRAGLHHEWAPSILAKRTHGVKVGGRRFGQTNPRSTAVDCNGTSN